MRLLIIAFLIVYPLSSEKLFQMALPGVKPDMDINVYNGTVDDLRSNWPLTRSTQLRSR